MRRFDLGIALNYCSNWGVVEAVREFYQNALDAEIVNPSNKMYFEYIEDEGILRIGNKDGELPTKTLLLGVSSKRNDLNTIGQHGEGYKVATVVLKRLGLGVKVYNRKEKEVWTARIIKSRRYQTDVVVYDVEKVSMFKSVPNQDLIFEISGLTKEMYDEVVESNLHLQTLAEEDVLKSGNSRILLDDAHAGRIFVNGLFVCKSKLATYGYDFEPSLVKLDRDRGLIDSFDLQYTCGKVICGSACVDFIKDAKDTWDGEYIRFYDSQIGGAMQEVYEDEYKKFIEKNGEDAIPVDDTDEFNRLKRNGYNPVMVSRNQHHYITSAPSYESSLGGSVEPVSPSDMADQLEEWIAEFVSDEDSEAYKKGHDMFENILDYLRN